MTSQTSGMTITNIILSTCLLASVCVRQNVLSMVHLILLVCIPLFQTTKSRNLNATVQTGRPAGFVRAAFYVIFLVFALKSACIVAFHAMPHHRRVFDRCDPIGRKFGSLGLVADPADACLDAALTVVFAVATYVLRESRRPTVRQQHPSADQSLRDAPTGRGAKIAIVKHACLAAACSCGVVAPSLACSVYYALFVMTATATVLHRLTDAAAARLFRGVCAYTCAHLFALAAYQIEWARSSLAVDADLAKQIGLIAFRDYSSQCNVKESLLPDRRGHQFALPILLVVQHFLLWTYSNSISKNTSIISPVKSIETTASEFKLENFILVGVKTVGFKIVILVWSISYPGWFTLAMLLWATVTWIYLNTRQNLIVLLISAIILLFVEYAHTVMGIDVLKAIYKSDSSQWNVDTLDEFPTTIMIKTLFTTSLWIALDERNKQQSELHDAGPRQWSTKYKIYTSYAWITSLILAMLAYGFFGYEKINLIRIGYVVLVLLFLLIFQVSFKLWRKTIYLYWAVVILYSIVVITLTYVFQFYDYAKNLAKILHISDSMTRYIGLEETGKFKITALAVISIAILVYFQYFHEHFMNTLEVDRQTYFFGEAIEMAETYVDFEKVTWFSRICNTAKKILYVHFNKLEVMLVALSIMYKPYLLSGGLLTILLLWMLLGYNRFMAKLMFFYVASCVIITLGYQFSCFDHDSWTFNLQLGVNTVKTVKNHTSSPQEFGVYRYNVAELFGLKKFSSNALLFDFLSYELLVLAVIVLEKVNSVYLKFQHHPQNLTPVIFSSVTYADMNNGIPEFLMYMANDGFSLFGLEITLTTMVIAVSRTVDVFALMYALWVLAFAARSRSRVARWWPYFVAFVYSVTAIKYALHVITSFNSEYEMPLKTINIADTVSILIYDQSYSAWIRPLETIDFILLVFVSNQLAVFKNDVLHSKNGTNYQEHTILTTEEEFPDYMSHTRSYLDVVKRSISVNSMWIILFCMIWTGTNNVNLFSLGYLCAGHMLFKKGSYYFLMPMTTILKLWRWVLNYNISVIMFKVLMHLVGCSILNYFQWHSCLFMRTISMFCPRQIGGEPQKICGVSKNETGLFWDALTFTLLLFQRRFFESGHFFRLIDDTKAVAVLASKMGTLINQWSRKKKDESRQTDLESLEKVKKKLNKLRKLKEHWAKKQQTHFTACLDGEHMFKEISDDVYLVEKNDKHAFTKYGDSVTGSQLYRHFVSVVLYVTEKINKFSKEYRKIMQTLFVEKKLLMKNKDLFQLGQFTGSTMILSPMDSPVKLTNAMQYTDTNQYKHWSLQFLLALWNAVQSSTHLICYFAIFHNAVQNHYDFITMTPVVLVLFWGQLCVPRPSKTFWTVLITYMQITGVVKYICSFKEIAWVKEEAKLHHLLNDNEFYAYPTMQIGFGDYRHRLPTDLFVLLTLFLHRRKLMTLGLWSYKNERKEWVFDKKLLLNHKGQVTWLRLMIIKIRVHLMPIVEFYKDLRNHHADGTVNVYPAMLILIAVLIPYNILISNTATESVAIDRASTFVLKLFVVYVLIIIVDRWLYVKRHILGKLIFHLFLLTTFSLIVPEMPKLRAYVMYAYFMVSAYQIRYGYRHSSSFIWSRYTLFNLAAYKLYYYCPFVHETSTLLDWVWTDSSLTLMEWFKMDELFAHACCLKCVWNYCIYMDSERGIPLPRLTKMVVGGGIVMAILSILIFPIVWYSMFESKPDTPSSVELTITLEEDLTLFSTKSDDVQKLDSTDFQLMNKIYSTASSTLHTNVSTSVLSASKRVLREYVFDEISSVNAIPQSITSWPFTAYAFDKLVKLIYTSSSIKMTVDWSLTHYDTMKISKGKNTVLISTESHTTLAKCLNFTRQKMTKRQRRGKCPQLVVGNLLPKFIVLHLKSSDADVKPELMIHSPSNPYMDVGLTINFGENKLTYWWDMVEICPTDEKGLYLKKMPYSSCADDDVKPGTIDNIMYNIYVFSDRYSNTLEFLDEKGIVGLYTVIIVYVGYKLAFDIFRSFKFKLGYMEIPYPDRILQLCYEVYLVRTFKEFEMEEDLYAMLIFLFRSPETLIRYTRRPVP